MLAKPDPSTFQVLPWRGDAPGTARMFCDILMPDGVAVLRRPAPRAQAHARSGGRPGLHLLHPPGDRVLPVQAAAEARRRSPSRSTRAATSTTRRTASAQDFRREAITMLEDMGISVEFSHHEGAPGQQEIDLRYADALTTADNIMTFRVVVKEVALSARASTRRSCPSRSPSTPARACTPTCRCSRATATRSTRPAREYQLSKVGRSFIAGLLQHAAEITAVTNQWVNSYKRLRRRRRGAGVRLLGPQQPVGPGAGADVQAGQGTVDPRRVALARLRLQPLPRVRLPARRGPQGDRGGLRAARRAPRTTSGR